VYKNFSTTVLSGSVLHAAVHEHGNFLNRDISQGRVATCLRCGGMFNNDFIADLLTSLSVKEFRKSVSI